MEIFSFWLLVRTFNCNLNSYLLASRQDSGFLKNVQNERMFFSINVSKMKCWSFFGITFMPVFPCICFFLYGMIFLYFVKQNKL